MKITIELTDKHYRAMLAALDMTARCGIGQFRDIADLHHRDGDSATVFVGKRDAIDRVCREVLMPEFYQLNPHASYGIHNEQVAKQSKLAWELYCTLRYRHGDGGTWGDEPMPCSGEPMPSAVVERDRGEPEPA